jgi:membrane-bound lytic murein transglycosylase D
MKSAKDNLPKIFPAMVIALALLVSFCSSAVCTPSKNRERYQEGSISPDFRVSSTLRARVDFWKDIFTRYGSAQMVVHHRDFPQIVFGVIDLSKEKAEMSKRMFEKHRSSVSKSTVKEIGEQLKELARGGIAKSAFQSRVLEELKQRKLSVSILSRWVKDDLIRTQTGIKERYAEAVQRAWRYMPSMEQIFVKEFGLPKELTRLPFIESSFDYTAHSSVGAAGIWQFMPRTARVYKMAVGRYVDERRDPIKATRAAAKYLQTAYKALGSWPLAIISYNHGVGGVRSKLKKAGNRDLESIIEDPNERFFGFASTNFYPEFLAAVEVYNNHRIYFPDVKQIRPLEVVSYRIPRAVSARTVAQNLGIATEELREANYGLLEPVWRGKAYIPAGYTFHIPAKYKERGDAVLPNLKVKRSKNAKTQIIPVSGSIAQNGVYRVRRGDSLSAIARRYGTTVSALRKRNGLKSNRIYSGQNLRVVNTSAMTSRERYRKVKVRRGDSLGKLSKRYGVTVRRIQEANALSSNLIRIGEVIKIPYR